MKWHKEEIEFLKDNFSSVLIKDMSSYLKRSDNSIRRKLSKLRLIKRPIQYKGHKKWTRKEDKFLIENYKKLPTNEIAKILDRTLASVYLRLQIKKLIRIKMSDWTEKEIKFLKNNHRFLTNNILAQRLNRSISSIKKKLWELSLKRNKHLCEFKEGEIVNNQYTNPWIDEEISILKNNHNVLNNRELEKLLPKRTYEGICGKLSLLGLRRTEEFRREINPNWIDGRSYEPYPQEFWMIRKKILKRDEYICQSSSCDGKCKRVGVHHINYDKNDNRITNLITLCNRCNSLANKNRLFMRTIFEQLLPLKESTKALNRLLEEEKLEGERMLSYIG